MGLIMGYEPLQGLLELLMSIESIFGHIAIILLNYGVNPALFGWTMLFLNLGKLIPK